MINQWAQRWNIPPTAIAELAANLGAIYSSSPGAEGSEAGVQSAVRLAHVHQTGGRLWRNNVGACQSEDGRHIRYGLANDSPAANKVMKSSDLIGITPVRCQCGQLYGVFTAYEVKTPGWSFRPGDKRAQAQLVFLQLVTLLGGRAKFITDARDI